MLLPSHLLKEVPMRTTRWLVAGLLVFCTPIGVSAQSKWEFTPFLGMYVPTSDQIEVRDVLQTGDRLTAKQQTTVVFGARVGVSISDRVVLEGSFGYSPSSFKATYHDPSNLTSSGDTAAHVTLASARALVGLGPAGRSTSWHLTLGAGLVSHGGAGYEGIGGLSDFGGVVGIGAKFKVGKSLALRLDLEDNLYSAKFTDTASGAETESKFQNDIALLVGLAIPLGGSSSSR
jgi:hypothetical protein